MKAADLADLLAGLGRAQADRALGRLAAGLAPGFAARGTATAKAACAALGELSVPVSGTPDEVESREVGAAAVELRALAEVFAPHLKPGPRSDLAALAGILAKRGDVPLCALIEAWRAVEAAEEPVRAPAGAAAVAAIDRHAAALKAALGDTEAFEAALADLETAAKPRGGVLMAADVAAVARAVLERSVGKTKAEALAALRRAHSDILEARARVGARAGRGAG